jgi:hypothetical protein
MIDPETSWFEIVELPTDTKQTVPNTGKGKKEICKDYNKETEVTFDKSSTQISHLVYKTWFSRYPHCQNLIYDNGSEFKLRFRALWDTCGIKCKPTSVKNLQANAILEQIHAFVTNMLRTVEIDMADSVKPSDIDDFLSDAAWAICIQY